MLGNYLQQTILADDISKCIFLGALRVYKMERRITMYQKPQYITSDSIAFKLESITTKPI